MKNLGVASKLDRSINGVIAGLVLAMSAVAVLFRNEGLIVHRYQLAQEIVHNIKSISSDTYRIENENSLLHIVGKRTTQDSIVDKEFHARITGVLKAKRIVDMLQRVEIKDNSIKNQTNYQYKKAWSSHYIDSDNFHEPGYVNPAFPFSSKEFEVSKSSVGVFAIDPLYLTKITSYVPLTKVAKNTTTKSGTLGISLSGAYLYPNKKAADALEIGAIRVRYEVVPEQVASFVGKQNGKALQVYETYTDQKIVLVKAGQSSLKSILDHVPGRSIVRVRSLRIVGFLIMYSAILLLLGPVRIMQKEGGNKGTGSPAIALIAIVIGLSAVLMTNALAWIFVKHRVSVVCITFSLLCVLTIKKRSRLFSS